MALVFNSKATATIKGLNSDGSKFSVPGCTTASITPAQAATQINKIFDIVGKTAVGDSNMSRCITEEVVDDE